MGKFLETKHSNINQKILRKPSKPLGATSCSLSENLPIRNLKRKLKTNNLPYEPNVKKQKLDEATTAANNLSKLPTLKNELDQLQLQELDVKIEKLYPENYVRLLVTNKDDDLSSADELRASYFNYTCRDWLFHIFDEIALEGLDGITTEALWKRLNALLDSTVNYDHLKNIIWQVICLNNRMSFYQLPEERPKLEIYDRYEDVDQEIGIVRERLTAFPNIYPIEASKDDRGSCTTYFTRVDISNIVRNNTLEEIKTIYSRKLVIVADRDLRKKSLYHETTDPLYEAQPVEYCILERVGRSRYLGEISQGNNSLTQTFVMDPRSLFHYKKMLVQQNLLAKQFFLVRSSLTVQNKSGRLLHLRRFFNKKKPKNLLIAETLINFLKRKRGFRTEVTEVRDHFPSFYSCLKKLYKNHGLKKYVKMFQAVPYREIYPDALQSEWQLKNKNERIIRIVELKDPYVNVSACWNETDNPYDSDEEDVDDNENCQFGVKSINRECIREVYLYILSKGQEGCSLTNIFRYFDVERLVVRGAIKRLLNRKFIEVRRVDKGKQRVDLYLAKCLVNNPDNMPTLAPKSIKQNKPSSVLEKLKQKQREHINKEDNKLQVYTKKQFELDEERLLLNEKPPLLPIKIDLPNIVCRYFVKYTDDFKMDVTEIKDTVEIFTLPNNKYQYLEKFSLNLSFDRLTNKITIDDIKSTLQRIDSNSIIVPITKSNPDVFESNKYSFDVITKLFLLKALFQEIDNDAFKVLDCHQVIDNKVEVDSTGEKPAIVKGKPSKYVKSKEKLNFMGTDPIVVYEDVDQKGVLTKILQSSLLGSANYRENAQYECNEATMTERVIDRLNIILKTLEECEIMEDICKFVKIIVDIENKEGYDRRIDRKSLYRLFYKLVQEGYVKIYKVTIQDNRITKHQTFMCKPGIDHTHSIIKSACEQIKWKFFVGSVKKNVKPTIGEIQQQPQPSTSGTTRHPKPKSPFVQTDIVASISELKELNNLRDQSIHNTYNRNVGKAYGLRPKCVRMRVMHEFLYYLVYDFNRNQKDTVLPLTDTEVMALFKRYNIILTENDVKKLPPVYCKEISWKMFIPPLPKHKGWPNGWALLCDVILRIPLSVLVSINNVPFEERELKDTLQHPIKKYYLMKNHSDVVRNVVLHKRKYLFKIHEILCRLAYCGLLQFGPEKFKEKDQTFIYLNKRASLWDTTTSAPGYHRITDKEYPMLKFVFTTTVDVDNYWYSMYNISMNTKLNARDVMVGKTITLFDIKAKPNLLKALNSKTAKEAIESDTGEVPGDRRGAAGLDSAMWTHLARNWFWVNQKKKVDQRTQLMGLKQEKLQMNSQNLLPYEELKHGVGPSTNKVYLPKREAKKQTIKPLKTKKKVVTKRKVEHRLFVKKKMKANKREYYDDIDKAILRKMGTLHRAHWTAIEDKVLFLCRIVSVFLNPKNMASGKQLIPYNVVRDILNMVLPYCTKDKTSRACQRRIKILQRVDPNCSKLEENASNLLKLEPIGRYFTPLIKQIITGKDQKGQEFRPSEYQLIKAFVILMSYCVPHRVEIEQMLQGCLLTVDHLSKENLEFTEKNVEAEVDNLENHFGHPRNEVELKKVMLKDVLHSSLGNRTEYPGWAYHLFRIYEKFSDDLIRETVLEMKDHQFISIRKRPNQLQHTRGHVPFDLSNYYVYSQGTTFSHMTALEAYRAFNTVKVKVRDDDTFMSFAVEVLNEKKYGRLLALNEIASFWDDKLSVKVSLPEQPIILDPAIQDHSELIDEIAKRYRLKLRKAVEEREGSEVSVPVTTATESDVSSRLTEPSSEEPTKLLDPDTTENSNTIKNLQSWLNDCMVADRVRSPSPEFFQSQADNRELEKMAKTYGVKTDLAFMVEVPVLAKGFEAAVPSLEEIKEGMLKETSTSTETRQIPYITDLIDLLSDNYSELNSDQTKLNQLKDHFIPQYPYIEDVQLENVEEFDRNDLVVGFIENNARFQSVMDRIRRDTMIKQPIELDMLYERLRNEGMTEIDVNLVENVIDFVKSKGVLGATGRELKDTFLPLTDLHSLLSVVNILSDCNILLRAGVCNIAFVHYNFQSTWLIESFRLSGEEQNELERNKQDYSAIKDNINKRLGTTEYLQVKLYPWVLLDGTINVTLLKYWLSKILSYCVDYPKALMQNLCEKFCFMKPVDLFYLLEVLEDLGCVRISVHHLPEDLWSEWHFVDSSYATVLDDFEYMYVEATNIAMTCSGSFYSKFLEKC